VSPKEPQNTQKSIKKGQAVRLDPRKLLIYIAFIGGASGKLNHQPWKTTINPWNQMPFYNNKK